MKIGGLSQGVYLTWLAVQGQYPAAVVGEGLVRMIFQEISDDSAWEVVDLVLPPEVEEFR
jgi:hypothetical protein